MEFIVELVLATLWEIVLQLVAEIVVSFGFASAGESLRQRRQAHPVFAGIGVALMGCVAGVIASLIWPARILEPGPVPGASLVLSPLITGVVMDRYGRWTERRGGHAPYIATFTGGALFAFSMAFVRYIWVGL
jgi:hypothetical protein